jgi:two-component system, LuxR family, response regulator FixJ
VPAVVYLCLVMTALARTYPRSPEETGEKTIVIVDDDALVCESLAALLEAYGYAVQSFATGLDFLAARLPEACCVLLDIKMPRCSGLEVLVQLQRRGSPLPVILITGGLPRHPAGALACLRKPILPEELFAQIDRAFAAP